LEWCFAFCPIWFSAVSHNRDYHLGRCLKCYYKADSVYDSTTKEELKNKVEPESTRSLRQRHRHASLDHSEPAVEPPDTLDFKDTPYLYPYS